MESIDMSKAEWIGDGFADEASSRAYYTYNRPFTYKGENYLATYFIPMWWKNDMSKADIDWTNPDKVLDTDGNEAKSNSDNTGFYGDYDHWIVNPLIAALNGLFLAAQHPYATNFAIDRNSYWSLHIFDTPEERDHFIDHGTNTEMIYIEEAVMLLGFDTNEIEEFKALGYRDFDAKYPGRYKIGEA